jgi:hypothetical protein
VSMLCSKCSEVVRPVVAIDIDGTLGDYHGHFVRFAAEWLGRSFVAVGAELYDGTARFSEWFCASFNVDLATFRSIKLAYRQGGMKRTMPVYPGAANFVNSLSEFAEVWITTTRPHDRYDRVDPDTREWLSRNGVEYDGLLYEDAKMEALASRVDPSRVAFVLDDLPETLESAVRLFPGAGTFLRRSAWNRGVQWPLMIGELLDARAVATAHLQDWAISNHFDDLPTTD